MPDIINQKKQKLLIITGPTGAGKTKISIGLAKALNGEIISADSMQVYKGMNIGSAKITEEEMQGVKHHLIDILSPFEAFDVTIFQKLAKEAIDDISSRGKLPIVVGGTGFYIQALRKDVDFKDEPENTEIRERLTKEYEAVGAEVIHERLKEIDPLSYERIPAGNVKRVIRALEFYELHKYPISAHNDEERRKSSVYDDLCVVLCNERSRLYDSINRRVEIMVEDGLFEEVAALRKSGLKPENNTSMQGIGYKEFFDYSEDFDFDANPESKQDVIEKIKLDTRHFAKRQFTYFKGMDDVIWFDKSQYESPDEVITREIIELAKQKFLL